MADLEVLEVTDNRVVIRGGKYEMRFIDKGDGKPHFDGFRFLSDRMSEYWVPKEYFNPAIKRAGAIFWARKKRKKRKERQMKWF